MRSLISWTAVVASLAFGSPTPDQDVKKHPGWKPAGPNDVRSPCPLLNSLANHDILPHNGKDITVPILKKAFKDYINVGHDVATVVGSMGVALSPKPHSNSFDLDDLDKHNAIEHDGSLSTECEEQKLIDDNSISYSRDDYYFDHNDHTFNHTIFNQAVVFFQKKTINPSDAAKARHTRHKNSRQTNPHYTMSKEHFQGTFTEAAFYLSVFGSPHTGIVPESRWIRYWFRNRRLPYALGWTPRIHETNLTTLTKVAKMVQEASQKQYMAEAEVEFKFVPH